MAARFSSRGHSWGARQVSWRTGVLPREPQSRKRTKARESKELKELAPSSSQKKPTSADKQSEEAGLRRGDPGGVGLAS